MEKVTVEVVKMDDGRTVTFSGRKRAIRTCVSSPEGVSIRVDLRNGQTLTLKLPQRLEEMAIYAGLDARVMEEIKVQDSWAGIVARLEGLQATFAQGKWSARESADPLAGASQLVQALVGLYGKSREQIESWLSGKSKAEQAKLRKTEKVAAEIARLGAKEIEGEGAEETLRELEGLG